MRLGIEGCETTDESSELLPGSLWISEKSKRIYILLYNYEYDNWCTYAMETLTGPQRVSWRGDHKDPAEAVKGLVPAPPLTIRWE